MFDVNNGLHKKWNVKWIVEKVIWGHSVWNWVDTLMHNVGDRKWSFYIAELNFDNSNVDASRTLSCLEKLEAAVGNTLKQSLWV